MNEGRELMHSRFVAIIGMAILAAAPSQQSWAQTNQQLDWCNGDRGATPDQQISGCNAVIQSGRRTGQDLAFAYNRRGKGYALKKNFDRAIADYTQAIKIYPNFEAAFANRGNAYYEKKDYDRALADFTQAIRLNPKQSPFYANRGIAYYVKKDYDRAIADYDQAIRINPKDTGSAQNRALAIEAKKQSK